MMRILQILIIILFTCRTLYSYDIEGRLLDERWLPVPGISVSITNGGAVSTDEKGYFRLSTGKMPYNLFIHDEAGSIGVLYHRMTILNPEIFLFGTVSSKNIHTEFVKVDFLPIPPGRNSVIKFLSDEVFNSPDIYASAGEKTKLITIEYPSYLNSINGRIVYLEKSQSKYEKYSERPVILSKGFYPQNIIFDSSAYYTTPITSYINIYLPPGDFSSKGFKVYADFLSLHRNAEILLNTTEGDLISTRVMVPQNMQLGYRLKVTGYGYQKAGLGFENYNYTYPGSALYLSKEEPPSLVTPQNKYYSVNNNTLFTYEWGSGSGIYIVHFHGFDPVGDFYLVTLDRTIKAPMNMSGGVLKGKEYSWQVMKYLSYISIDDFTKPRRFANDLGYKAILYSELFTFKTW
ncbi:MAG: carboxypeptidase regulatory-like domain-containing protein [Ignavibacteria bacterium]|nr:carboxypeptidase regulatory-like domain-containing protein [Ignavibacteria bacterium]